MAVLRKSEKAITAASRFFREVCSDFFSLVHLRALCSEALLNNAFLPRLFRFVPNTQRLFSITRVRRLHCSNRGICSGINVEVIHVHRVQSVLLLLCPPISRLDRVYTLELR